MTQNSPNKLLEVRGLTMDFGGLRAMDSVSLDIYAGEIVALIGPNGAGKTTFFNCVTGIYKDVVQMAVKSLKTIEMPYKYIITVTSPVIPCKSYNSVKGTANRVISLNFQVNSIVIAPSSETKFRGDIFY